MLLIAGRSRKKECFLHFKLYMPDNRMLIIVKKDQKKKKLNKNGMVCILIILIILGKGFWSSGYPQFEPNEI